jgi:hypothetical protein
VDLRCVVRVFLAPTLGVNDFDMILAPRYAAIFAVRNNLTTDIPHYVPHQWREPRATKLVIQDNSDGKYRKAVYPW